LRFDAVNHLEGTAGLFTVSMSLAIDAPVTAAAAGRSEKAKFRGDTTTCTSIQTHSVECYRLEQRISGLWRWTA
jgi:hypothetical protein